MGAGEVAVNRPKHRHVGMQGHRLLDRERNAEEVKIAGAWQKVNDEGAVLGYLLGDGRTPVTPTPRDVAVAATVVQWLGSEIGQGFLRALGYSSKRMR